MRSKKLEGNEILENIIGCRIQTHYGTGGTVASYSGPYDNERGGPNSWSITYQADHDRSPQCFINSIKTDGGIITCEGKPLKILGREENVQMTLF